MKKWIFILFGLICVLTIFLFVIFNFFVFKRDYKFYVEKYSAKYGLEEAFVYAVIKAESDFNEKAISPSGALGLMQIIPLTAKWIAGEFDENYSKEKLLTAETNIKYGCFYLNYLFSKFNDEDVVICAYNAGEGAVKEWLDENGKLIEEKITYAETKTYLSRVKNFYGVYKNQ